MGGWAGPPCGLVFQRKSFAQNADNIQHSLHSYRIIIPNEVSCRQVVHG